MLPSRIWVAGHRGMLGSALVRRLKREQVDVLTVAREELDLTDRLAVRAWLAERCPDAVIVAAARVGGILANRNQPADFLRDNLAIALNVIDAAHEFGVGKLLYIGSSAAYPAKTTQPIREGDLMTGSLDPDHEPYSVAKIAGLKLCQAYRRQFGDDFISAMPTNLYGPGDNFDPTSGHVLAALIRKAHQAKLEGLRTLSLWGTGSPRREFLHVDDCADACVHLMEHYSDPEQVNVGSGTDIAIIELARLICRIVGFDGDIVLDASKPDGVPRKLMSADKLKAMGWTPSITLEEGIKDSYRWYLKNCGTGPSGGPARV